MSKLKYLGKIFFIALIAIGIASTLYKKGIIYDSLGIHIEVPFKKRVEIPIEYMLTDRNNNGIPDPIDIVNAARNEVEQRTTYKSVYYAGGFPPDNEGVCTDVIWRGLLGAGIEFKDLIDEDIKNHVELYPRVDQKPDPNIDFRRVPNQFVYFQRFTESLTTELRPRDVTNLAQWQPGDIVVFLDGFHHVGIVSDKRDKDGVPYLIHNNPPFAAEVKLTSFTTPIAGHYRWHY